MRPRSTLFSLLLLIGLLPAAFSQPARGGANHGATAYLSWSSADSVSALEQVVADAIPIYVRIRGLSGFTELAIELAMSPYDSSASCYRLTSGAQPSSDDPDSLRGWAEAAAPGGPFAGDSSYTWTIHVVNASLAQQCIQYKIDTPACDTLPEALLELRSVIVRDLSGSVDTLEITGGATLQLDPWDYADSRVDRVYPSIIPTGGPATVQFEGARLGSSFHAYVDVAGERYYATRDTVEDSLHVTAQFDLPSSLDGLAAVGLSRQDVPIGPSLAVTLAPSVVDANSAYPYRPSNYAFPFRQVDFFTYRQVTAVADHVSHPQWPTQLQNANYLVGKLNPDDSFDSVAVINSRPFDGIGFEGTASATFTLDQPKLANTIGLIGMGGMLFNGINLMDVGLPLLDMKLTFANGDTLGTMLYAASHIRNWFQGLLFCNQHGEYFADQPPGFNRSIQLYSGPSVDNANTVFYDFMSVVVPDSLRSSPVKSISFSGVPRSHTCSEAGDYNGSSALFGLALWPDFTIQNSKTGSVAVQKQGGASVVWGSDLYGGYLSGGRILGARKTVGKSGCLLTCLAMGNSFLGFPATPRTLNQYLQSNQGYGWRRVGRIQQIAADTVYLDRGSNESDIAVGDSLLIVADSTLLYTRPVATLYVTGTSGRTKARITSHLPGETVSLGQQAGVFSLVNSFTATSGITDDTLSLVSRATGPAGAESTLAKSLPVALEVKGPNAAHWVLADGWNPAYSAPGGPTGTYAIADPGYSRSRLLEYGNRFRHIHAYKIASGGSNLLAVKGNAVESNPVAALTLTLDGPGFMTVTCPNGERVFYSPDRDEYWSTDEVGVLRRGYEIEDVDDPNGTAPSQDIIELPMAVAGTYRVMVQAQADGECTLRASDWQTSSTIHSASASALVSSGSLRVYDVSYGGSGGAVSIAVNSQTDVDPAPAYSDAVRLWPNPFRSGVTLSFSTAKRGAVGIEMFDVQGRKIATLYDGLMESGSHMVRWTGDMDNGAIAGPGLYFMKMRRGVQVEVRRVVMVR